MWTIVSCQYRVAGQVDPIRPYIFYDRVAVLCLDKVLDFAGIGSIQVVAPNEVRGDVVLGCVGAGIAIGVLRGAIRAIRAGGQLLDACLYGSHGGVWED